MNIATISPTATILGQEAGRRSVGGDDGSRRVATDWYDDGRHGSPDARENHAVLGSSVPGATVKR